MQFFLSYAKLDWDAEPNALPLFYDRLTSRLKRKLKRDFKIYWDRDLKEQSSWEEQLVVQIEASEGFIINLSKCWLESEVCWDEYHFARESGFNNDRIFLILYDADGLDKAEMPAGFMRTRESTRAARVRYEEAKAEMIGRAKRDQQTFNAVGYWAAIREASKQSMREDHMNDVVDPLVEVIAEKMDMASVPDRPPRTLRNDPKKPAQKQHGRLCKIGGQLVDFAEIPAGRLDCPDTGRVLDVAKAFYIMKSAVPAQALFGAAVAAELTFDDLLYSGSGGSALPRGLSLPSETEWDHAMLSGMVDPHVGPRREATRSRWMQRRGDDQLAVKGQDIVLKSGPPDKPVRSRISARTRVRETPLRLVIREDRR